MKNISLILLAVCIIFGSAFTVNNLLPIGSKMPEADHKMLDVSGKQVSMKDVAKQNGVLVMFSCNTCPYVVKNQTRTVAISKFAEKAGFGVIILNSNEAYRGADDSYEAMKAYAKDQKYEWKYVVDKDHKIADIFGANRTPECFLFDKNLTLVYHGAIDDNPGDEQSAKVAHLKNAIEAVAKGNEVSVKETRSVGCSIKRNK